MRRIAELDALRGIAAVVIVVFHLRFVGKWPVLGTMVDLFFVLSGYLITSIIRRHGDEPGFVGAFYARRGLRIWPIYYVGIALALLINRFEIEPMPTSGWWLQCLYLQNLPKFLGIDPSRTFPQSFDHSWTLAIEEQFYLIWPLLIRRRSDAAIRRIAVATVAASLLMGLAFAPSHSLLGRCDGLALGSLLAATLPHAGRIGRRRLIGALATALAVSAVFALIVYPGDAGHAWKAATGIRDLPRMLLRLRLFWLSLGYAGLVGLVVLHAGSPGLIALRWRPLVFLGEISYGVYLYHPFVIDGLRIALERLGLPNPPMYHVLRLVLSVLLAAASWHAIERPILRLKRRFEYRGSGAVVPAPHVGVVMERAEPEGLHR